MYNYVKIGSSYILSRARILSFIIRKTHPSDVYNPSILVVSLLQLHAILYNLISSVSIDVIEAKYL